MMSNKNAIIEIIFTSIKEVNENQPSDNRLKLKLDEFLVSDKSKNRFTWVNYITSKYRR